MDRLDPEGPLDQLDLGHLRCHLYQQHLVDLVDLVVLLDLLLLEHLVGLVDLLHLEHLVGQLDP